MSYDELMVALIVSERDAGYKFKESDILKEMQKRLEGQPIEFRKGV